MMAGKQSPGVPDRPRAFPLFPLFLIGILPVTLFSGASSVAHPQSSPRDLLNVVDFLVPELQRRGRFRTKYEGTMLKDNLRIAA